MLTKYLFEIVLISCMIIFSSGTDLLSESYGSDIMCKEHADTIKLVASKQRFFQGENITISGAANSDKHVEITIQNPKNQQVFADVINPDSFGNFLIEFPLEHNAMKGAWSVFVIHEDKLNVIQIHVGINSDQKLAIMPDKLNHSVDKDKEALFLVVGKPSGTTSVVVTDSANNEKFAGTLTMPDTGICDYVLDLKDYESGIYTIKISDDHDFASHDFTVGIQPSGPAISIWTQLDVYYSDEAVLILGNTQPGIDVTIDVYDPAGNVFAELAASSDQDGNLSTSFHLPDNAKNGTWKIKARSGSIFDVVEINVDGPDVFASQQTMSPLKQFKTGVPVNEIQCKQNLVLAQKYDGTPVCVTESTKQKLIERGWTGSIFPCHGDCGRMTQFDIESYKKSDDIDVKLEP